MKFAAHPALKGLIDHLMLLNPGFSGKSTGDDKRGIVIAIARKVLDRHLGVGKTFLDKTFDCTGVHRHSVVPRYCLLRSDRLIAG